MLSYLGIEYGVHRGHAGSILVSSYSSGTQ
jgi:hypothetical protein